LNWDCHFKEEAPKQAILRGRSYLSFFQSRFPVSKQAGTIWS
jgi:hypothetical protein